MKSSDSDVASKMRQAIFRGELVPRERLVEADLMERFGASRFGVRSALNELAAEGLVVVERNKGARVREVTLDEAVEITEVRAVVEGLIARKAAQKCSPADAKRLRALGKRMERAVKESQPKVYSDLNSELHQTIRQVGHHQTGSRIVETLRGQIVRHQFMISLVPGRPDVSLAQHLEILQAIIDRDPDRAELAMRKHIENVAEVLTTLGAGEHAGWML